MVVDSNVEMSMEKGRVGNKGSAFMSGGVGPS